MIIIGQIHSKEKFEKHFECTFSEEDDINPKWNISEDDIAYVITSEKPHNFQQMNYGLTPFWSVKSELFYEAPVDDEHKKDYAPEQEIKKKIINRPEFRRPIRENRCIIPVDYFICIDNGKAFMFFHQDQQPFAIAGVYDKWKPNIKDKENQIGFSILTFPSYGIFLKTDIVRVPFLLPEKNYKKWLSENSHLADVTQAIAFYPDEKINGYEINFSKVEEKLNERSLILPVGNHLKPFKKHSGISEKLGFTRMTRRKSFS